MKYCWRVAFNALTNIKLNRVQIKLLTYSGHPFLIP